MYIQEIETFHAAIPLNRPFKTALRTVTVAETVVVKITCDNGVIGWGEAPPTHVITGDSIASIDFAVSHIFKPLLTGEAILNYERVFKKIDASIIGNTSAKAAVDMAIYDCIAQHASMPLAQFLGGYNDQAKTDYTVSVNSPDEMADDAQRCLSDGFTILKVKVGKDTIDDDVKRIQVIRKRIGSRAKIRLDANQAWQAKEAVRAIRRMEDLGLDIELIEQPVHMADFDGLKYVTANTETPIMADESVFSPSDAKRLLEMRAADLINIKLMKAGGIHHALKIAKLADINGLNCMVGSMIETKIGLTAAAHFAASQPNIRYYDFDAPLMLSGDLIEGGITYDGSEVSLGTQAGLGIEKLNTEFLIEK